ncbi:hypothetical protein I6A84_35435 [Frankia sp. CNm7]|uniref:Uncharacterized protein n=1 Tax=Frankia nepalensis TaxID=1836974 RepID=A0A937USA6_9ACTN|nr:hypothetical protein [Frankia nepalensis]MBL7495605.1 hypothetical protein [Frankia nepalensis]MBL7508851.1 hypothetical protein [Frankia nepalensis]MBL7523236.1 hypothetical protein [Frankia nepalensis]MBL7630075.1 hypothetical protein [Frankia nepalensis]
MRARPVRAPRTSAVTRLVEAARRAWPRVPRAAVWVLVAVALVIGGTLLTVGRADGDDETVRPEAARAVSDLPAPAPQWRLESFLDAVVEVPASWGYAPAPASDWCAATEQPRVFPEQPYVNTRGPGAPVLMIACPPTGAAPDLHGGDVPREHWAPHVWFAATPAAGGVEEVPDGRVSTEGWTRLVRTVGSAKVFVLTDDAHLGEAERIIASARQSAVDQHGCAASSPIQAGRFVSPPAPFDLARLDTVDSVAVCHYDLSRPVGTPGLLASHELGGAGATALLAAIQAAPVGGGPDTPDTCVTERWGDTGIVLRLTADGSSREAYVYYDWCFGNGIDDGTTRRALTPENCGPLWSGRVVVWSGSGAPFAACDPAAVSGKA